MAWGDFMGMGEVMHGEHAEAGPWLCPWEPQVLRLMEAEGAAGKACDVRELTEQCFQKERGAATPKAAERSREVGKCPCGSAPRGYAHTAESSSGQQGGLKVHWSRWRAHTR